MSKIEKLINELASTSADYFYELEEGSSEERLKVTKKEFEKAKKSLKKHLIKFNKKVKKSSNRAKKAKNKLKMLLENS
jgi:hypothetical protein